MPFGTETVSRRALLAAGASLIAGHAFAGVGQKRRLAMVAGAPSHPAGMHEFNAGVWVLNKVLAGVPGLEVVVHHGGWPKDRGFFDGADGILLYSDGGAGHMALPDENLNTLRRLMAKGVGLMCAHYAVEVPKDRGAEEWRAWIGGCYEHQYSCNPLWAPKFEKFPDHPICRGVQPFAVNDEWYMNMRFRPGMQGITPLLTAAPSDQVRNGPYVWPAGPYSHIQAAKGQAEHLMWCVERPDGGRGVGFTGGHFHRNWGDDNFRKIFCNALCWISKLEIPANGVGSSIQPDDLKQRLDPKPAPKKKQ